MSSLIQNKINFSRLPDDPLHTIIQFIGPVIGDRRTYTSLKTTCKLLAQLPLCTEFSLQQINRLSFSLKSRITKIIPLIAIAYKLQITPHISKWIEKWAEDSSIVCHDVRDEPIEEFYHSIEVKILTTFNLNDPTFSIGAHFPEGTYSKTHLLLFEGANADSNTIIWNAHTTSLTFSQTNSSLTHHFWVPPMGLKADFQLRDVLSFSLENLANKVELQSSFNRIVNNTHSLIHVGINSQARIHRIIRECFANIYFKYVPDPFSNQPVDLTNCFCPPSRDPKAAVQRLFNVVQLIAEYVTPTHCSRCTSHENRIKSIHEAINFKERIHLAQPVNGVERHIVNQDGESLETLISLYAEEM